MDQLITKPVNINQLKKIVEQAILLWLDLYFLYFDVI